MPPRPSGSSIRYVLARTTPDRIEGGGGGRPLGVVGGSAGGGGFERWIGGPSSMMPSVLASTTSFSASSGGIASARDTCALVSSGVCRATAASSPRRLYL